MGRRSLVFGAVFAAVALCLIAATSAEQRAAGATSNAAWTPPLTPEGRSDLSGFWTNDTYTPLERPAELAGKEFFTPEEAAAFVKSRIDRLMAQAKDDIHYDDAIWQAENYAKQANRRTSLIVDPKDGRLPPLTAEAKVRLPRQNAAQRAVTSDSAQSRSLAERCITWGNVGPPMMPPTYSANMQILQSRDTVVIWHEMMDDVRIIYLDGRAHPSPKIQWLAGHSIGRWDGPTLVVDTTNFTERTNFRGSPQNTRQDIFATESLHVVERFTPTGPGMLRYEFTVNDPKTWTQPWSGEMPIRRFDGPLYEYACHEGNYGLANILRGARMDEAAAASGSTGSR